MRLLPALLVGLLCLLPLRPASAQPLVAAASDLQFALRELAEAFTEESGRELRLVFGSSGNLTRQIEKGAPFELFLSADESYVERLVEAGLTRDEGTLYAHGHLALLLPPDSPLELDPSLADLKEAAAAGSITRFAIANPEHAPYGRAARQALEAAGAWDAVQPALVLGENVSQAAQFAISGSVQGGLVALSLVMAPTFEGRGSHVAIPEESHSPLRQRMVLTRRASEDATAFYDYLGSPEARDIFARYGFTLPEGAD